MHSHQNLSCLRSGVGYPRFIDDDTVEELFKPLLRQLNFWCKCGIRLFFGEKTVSYLLTASYILFLGIVLLMLKFTFYRTSHLE